MAELATIARPYAEALFKASGDNLDGTLQWLDPLAAVAAQPQLLQYAGNPKVENRQVYDLVVDVARACSWTPRARTSCAPSSTTAAWPRCPRWRSSSAR